MSGSRNVLLITAEQWRGDSLSAVGHPCVRTPRLDALARDGVLFRQHYAQATPCGPGRANLYTGMYLHNHRCVVNGAPLDARHTNIALESRRAGYEPSLFGHTDMSADPRGLAPGDPATKTAEGVLPGMTPIVWMDERFLPWRAHLIELGYRIPAGEIFRPEGHAVQIAGRGSTFAPARFKAEHSEAAFLVDEVTKYLSVRQHEPWFVHLSFHSVHPPFVTPAPYNTLYDPGEVPLPVRTDTAARQAAQHPYLEHYLYHQRGTGYSFGRSSKHNLEIDEHELRQMRATYYGMMSEVDAQIGRLLDNLAASDAHDRTLIVFTSDHGEHLGDHWMLAKYSYFDETFHIPLIIRDPTSAADDARGRQIDRFTESVDVMPTLLDWLGLSIPSQCDGESLLPFLRGREPRDWREETHCEFDFRDHPGGFPRLGPEQCNLTVLRGKRYKYVHFAALPPLFFDLAEDPHEFRNLAGLPDYRPLMLEHAQKLLSWRMTHEAPVID